MVKLSFQYTAVHLGLEHDCSSTHVVNSNTDSEEFTSSVEGEFNDTGESDESSSLFHSEEYLVNILSNTTAGKNNEKDSYAALVTPALEEDQTHDEMPSLASDDDSHKIDGEMSESSYLVMGDVELVVGTTQEDSNR